MAFLMISDPCPYYTNLLTKLDNDYHPKDTDNCPTTLTTAYSLLVKYHVQSFQNSNHQVPENDDS